MHLFDLGKLPGQQSMLIFHALARMGIESLVIVSPQSPLVSIGYFQDAEQEVDFKYCKGVEIYYGLHKARGGLVRTAEEIFEKEIEGITVSGDFTFHPKEHLNGLEESLEKAPLEKDRLIEKMETFCGEKGIESPGVDSEDFAMAVLNPVIEARSGQE